MDLAHLYRIPRKGLKQAAKTIADDSVDGEAVLLQPAHTLHVIRYRLMPDIFMPKDLTTHGISYDHKAEVPAPVGRVHLHSHILVLGNDMDMTHLTKSSLYRAYTFVVLGRQL